jgi:hypothetical protein
MKYLEAPIHDYPTKDRTDPEVLYSSLGSFWTQIFEDKAVLKGYTLGLAEELIQRYYELLEAVNAYSVKEIDVFHKEKWQPIIVYKSKFNSAPFLFKPDDAIFGQQSTNDRYYQSVIFKFGFSKKPSADVYLYSVGENFKDFGIIADRVFDPKSIYINGTDVILNDGILYFNNNIFDNPNFPKLDVIAENGEPTIFTDADGVTQQEQVAILWAYDSHIDENRLYYNFGYIFNLNLNNNEFFKNILVNVINLHIDGPSVSAIRNICLAFLDIKAVINETEQVVEIFEDNYYKFVVTDKEVYKFDKLYQIKPEVVTGAIFNRGFVFVDAVEYYDNVEIPRWWKSSAVLNKKLALSQYIFLGNYSNQLVFKNELDLISLDGNGKIIFPVEGAESDVKLFNLTLNADTANVSKLKNAFNLIKPGDSAAIIPVDFLMENFLKNNTSFFKFNFITNALQAKFLKLIPLLRSQLPPYVYFIFGLNFKLANDDYSNLNNAITITFENGAQLLNADGSNEDGIIEKSSPYFYNDVKTRLFQLTLAIPAQPNECVGVDKGAPDGTIKMKDGTPLREPTSGVSTNTFNKLQLLDFT